jgi:trk system potassium uptake protein TrkH
MIRVLGTQFNKLLHPHGVFLVRYGGQGVAPDIIFSVTAFLTLYLLSWAVLSSLVSFSGLDFQTSISAAAAALTNVGPAIGINNHYSDFNDINKILLSFGMLIGRLELFIVFVFLVPSFWKEN